MVTNVRSRILDSVEVDAYLAPSGRMQRAIDRLALAAAPVLLVGAPGRGKRWLARALHAAAGGGPMLLIEPTPTSPAGTDARALERLLADPAGSILLPPLERLPLRWQAALAEALDGARRRVIATLDRDAMPADVRVAVRRDVLDRFLPFTVPPLCDRGEDIEYLARAAMAVAAARNGAVVPPLGDLARARLRAHSWPGDCAELERFAERAVALSSVELALRDLDVGDMPSPMEWTQACERLARGEAIELEVVCRRVVRHAERSWIERVAASAAGDARRLATLLGLSPAALSVKLRDLGLSEMST